ncbi:hypothetical protein A1Q2_07717 [Trichosporon asahii var. asahii CBS 8904]|uniref:Uncharacterized protein n=1 Tax=Trichosporon asahii var. asahii (strain CBS 8904) TaxID=1220162 RepID=K1VAS5_TRIAC|nr:hypothetical protein A1Q2_07717 [Trichosporon asahii var. asahii CBS 8904]
MKFSLVFLTFLATVSAAPIPWTTVNPEGYDLTPLDVPGSIDDGVSPPGDAPVSIGADANVKASVNTNTAASPCGH